MQLSHYFSPRKLKLGGALCVRLMAAATTTMSSSSNPAANVILKMERLPESGPFPTLDPFLFCVYHKDHYPAAKDESMQAPRRGNGMDFSPTAPYRMYHGTMIPGFPSHPHRGFETITATMTGLTDHADSVGNAARYGMGDVQWMTAGKGIVHSEMFPLLFTDKPNTLRLFQIWLNLPARSKMVEPYFSMFWASTIPVWKSEDQKSSVTLWAGQEGYFGIEKRVNTPPVDSWANDLENDVAVWHIQLHAAGGKVELPAAIKGKVVNRSLFYVEGEGNVVSVNAKVISSRVVLQLAGDAPVTVELSSSARKPAELLLLQGRPINEPTAQYGPFVMNTQAEIQQAFADYQRTKFGGWPWPKDGMVFAREKTRFALQNGTETTPPSDDNSTTTCQA